MAVTRILREADVLRVIDMDEVITAVTAAMRELGEGKAQNEPRRRAFATGAILNVMFAAYPGGDCMGSKSYSVASNAVRFLVTVFGLDGTLRALIEADHMGAYRTGAASGVAARALARPGPVVVAIIGTGHQAETQALALARALEIAEMRVFSRNAETRAAFAVERSSALGIRVTAAASAEAAVRDADVVVTITTSSAPVVESAWVKDGALVIGAGSNFTTRTELPTDLVARAHTIVVDQLATARLESGDLVNAEKEGKFQWERAIELGTLLAGAAKPAAGAAGITLFESHGLALWDLAAASTVLPRAAAEGLGQEVELF
jgi:ornithine cyclodeaminase/alanine dehydrogenase-like protein (mu-crystallin family)